MNRVIGFTGKFLILMIFLGAFCAEAAFSLSSELKIPDIEVAKGRLFTVDIAVKSDKTLTAASFKLSYDPNEIEVRSSECQIAGGRAKSADDKGETTAIFLYQNGIKLSDSPLLLTIKYKKTGDSDTSIKVTPYDFVDENVKNFTPPKAKTVKIKAATKASRGSSYYQSRSGRKKTVSKSSRAKSAVSSKEAATASPPTEEPIDPEFVDAKKDYGFFIKTLPFVGVVFFFSVAALILIINRRSAGQKEKDLEARIRDLEGRLGTDKENED